VNQYMAGLITSLLELGLEGELLNILVQTFKVIHTMNNIYCHRRTGLGCT
jgi:hypothetical protein